MKQKDYKAIAEIINNLLDIPSKEIKQTERGFGYIKGLKDCALKLADYFEKRYEETNLCDVCGLQLVRGINCPEHGIRNIPFNRRQFLKDCGVN